MCRVAGSGPIAIAREGRGFLISDLSIIIGVMFGISDDAII